MAYEIGMAEDTPQELLSEQQAARARHEYYRDSIEVFDVTPIERLDGVPPLVLVGGWSQGPKSLTPAVEQFLGQGRRVISFAYGRGGDVFSRPSHYPAVLEHKAAMIGHALDDLGISDCQMIGHSEGGQVATIAALHNPERVSGLVLWASGGLTGPEGVTQLGRRLIPEVAQHVVRFATDSTSRNAYLRSVHEGAVYVAKNPLRNYQDGKAIARFDIVKHLQLLRVQGVKVAVLQASHDKIFPAEQIGGRLALGVVDAHASLAVRGATHHELVLQPEVTSAALGELLDSLWAMRAQDASSFLIDLAGR